MKKIDLTNTMIFSMLAIVLTFAACNTDHNTSGSNISQDSSNEAMSKSESISKYSFDGDGALIQPIDYRRWVYVGSPLTPNDMNPPEAAFPEFHNVYIHPSDFEYWEENGEWQDGTILVKELVTVGKKQHVSGNGYFQGSFTGLEATIKDRKRFPNEPGNWAYFSFGHAYPLAKVATAFPTAACNSCHQSAAADDFVFTQDYPVLRAAKNSKNKNLGYLDNSDFFKESSKQLDKEGEIELTEYLVNN